MSKGNGITISRDDQGQYVLTDYMGTSIYERKENLVAHLLLRLETQDNRYRDYKADPARWIVKGFSELTC